MKPDGEGERERGERRQVTRAEKVTTGIKMPKPSNEKGPGSETNAYFLVSEGENEGNLGWSEKRKRERERDFSSLHKVFMLRDLDHLPAPGKKENTRKSCVLDPLLSVLPSCGKRRDEK